MTSYRTGAGSSSSAPEATSMACYGFQDLLFGKVREWEHFSRVLDRMV